MEKTVQRNLLLYLAVSALSFPYLVLANHAGVSVPVFVLVQTVCLRFLLPERKRLWFLLPVLILSLNSFFSASYLWSATNFLVCAALYCAMFIRFDFKDTSPRFLLRIFNKAFEPVLYLHLPFVWALRANKEKTLLLKRVLIALLITVPCVIVLTAVLSAADLAFSAGVDEFINGLFRFLSAETFFKALFGIVVGFYLFGLLYSARVQTVEKERAAGAKQGDLIVFNLLLCSVAAIYTVFIVVQFRYLFAGASLPAGLTYTEYARKGFFEQLALTVANVVLIWLTVQFTKNAAGKWGRFTKILCWYLCAVTVLLLVSSFYRMWLYYSDDGLTRLRFFVFGFLLFELLALVFTFFYIARPRFNLPAVYLLIGLFYYLLLNLVPVDYFVAQSQVERYLSGVENGIAYTLTLSADAAPQIERLLADESLRSDTRAQVIEYFKWQMQRGGGSSGWQGFNLSAYRLARIYESLPPV